MILISCARCVAIKILLFSFLFSFSNSIQAASFSVGVNQAWWKTNYGSQWIYPYFDLSESTRLLDIAAKKNIKIFRLWLLEGIENQSYQLSSNGLEMELNQTYVANLAQFLEEAKKRNIQVSLTLFDGNVINQWGDRTPKRDFIYNLWLGNNPAHKDLRSEFFESFLKPVFSMIATKYSDVVTQIDIMNEIDALVFWSTFIRSWGVFPDWSSANQFVCHMYKQIKGLHPKGQITVSVGWAWAQNHILDGSVYAGCVDYFDLHLYNDDGSVPRCEDFKRLSKDKRRIGKWLQLGEFGQKSKQFNNRLQEDSTYNFIKNAKACGFKSALAWRLSDVRPGHNEEARYSFESNGQWRPAFHWLNTTLWNDSGAVPVIGKKYPRSRSSHPWYNY
jgi:endo-1,4-beta-mannosidase